ncbi:HIG1 domain-containing protein [Novosphingobium sp. SL115]|jgi:flagellar basal body-associated protein FliL|uniref:HIG1 domain-containing protein n=1 Tax=Novosphingobium sp. SL115 TaxID=2995150 RepID=UPI002277007B|nr:HIG1 domain-containing protein [Novosphingobium sp. SL115]MCY1670124.1 HIG1 domain-containing protein [Novosphingobium sp. SL115]
MKYFLIPIIIILVAMTVVSLVRGIIAFLKSTEQDLNADPAAGASEMQLLQNKMMFNRIKYQGMAVIVVAILLAVSR